MDRNDEELDCPHEEVMDSGLHTSNNLDLNIEQDCRSPQFVHDKGTQSSLSLEGESDVDGVLKIGTEFESDQHAYKFYNQYATLLGFSVRKDWVNRSKVHGQVVSRKFTCSREGYRRKDKRDANVKKHRKETRTGCMAHMIITRQSNGRYQVTQFEAKHNHDNINPNIAYILPLGKAVSQTAEEDSADNLGPHAASEYHLMNRRLRIEESLDDLAIYHDSSLQSERTRDMKEGEAGRLLRYFHKQHFGNPSFFHTVQLDMDDKVSNIFWADDHMLMDYEHFGDVVCLDTTGRSNQDLRPFVQFIGVNHHKQVLIFAASLLYDDTTESFKWLLRTFLEAMSGKKPKAILADQDASIIEAINSVLPETNHRVCVWQMYQNALKHLSHLVKDPESFASDFKSCIYDHKYEDDFVHAWDALLEKYSLGQNEWLRWMYREKENWAVVYGRNTFFLDARGSHMGEKLFHNLRNYLISDLDVLLFFRHFERVVAEQRYKEIEETYEISRSPPRLMGKVVLLKHASSIYTPRAFELFQQEYEKSLNVVVNQSSQNRVLCEYKTKTFGQTREYIVTFNSSDDTVVCSCMEFECVGFLCSHALKVLDHKNIKVVPSHYILKRWTREARFGSSTEINESTHDDPSLVLAIRYKHLCQRILKLSARASESEEAFQFATRQLDEVMEGVEKILTLKQDVQGIASSSTRANASESEPTDIFLDGKTIKNQDDNKTVKGINEKESVPPDMGHQLTNGSEEDSNTRRAQSVVEAPLTNIVSCISSPPPAYVSSQATTSSPIVQNIYNFEANQVVQCMYQHTNLVMDPPSNPNLFQPPNFFSNQHDSPGQSQLLQDPLLHSPFQEPIPNPTQLRQAMDLDVQNPHTSSFLLYDCRYGAPDSSYNGPK